MLLFFQISVRTPCLSFQTTSSGLEEGQVFSQIGLYKGNVVAVKKLDKYHIQLEGHEHKELTYVRYFYIKHGSTDVQYIYAQNFEEGALVWACPLWDILHLRKLKA